MVLRPLPPSRGIVWQERTLPPAAARAGLDVFLAPAYACPLRLETPRVTAIHDVSFFAIPGDFALRDAARRRWLAAAAVRVSRAILTISEFSRREIEAFLPAARGRVSVVPLGPDDDLPPAPDRDVARARLGADGPLVVTVGSIFNRRRLPELLSALALARARHPGLTLDVVGENRTHPRLDLAAAAEERGVGARVRLSGFVSESGLALRYAAADVAVFLSEYEGFGLPALEAMSRGVPVIVSARPALAEIFGAAALTVEPRDVGAIAAAIDRLLAEPAARAALVARGHALAASLSWEETARRTRDVLVAAARP